MFNINHKTLNKKYKKTFQLSDYQVYKKLLPRDFLVQKTGFNPIF